MDPATITVIGTVAIAVIGAIAAGSVSIIKALRDTDEKLGKIHVLVNSRYSAVLEELARVKALLAHATGLRVDKIDALVAQQNADDQAGRVDASTRTPE